jgi:hypothetical protein
VPLGGEIELDVDPLLGECVDGSRGSLLLGSFLLGLFLLGHDRQPMGNDRVPHRRDPARTSEIGT